MKDWKVGDEIVCINATALHQNRMPLKVGQVYKIRGFDAQLPYVLADYIFGIGVYVEGITQDISPNTGKEFSFYAWRFRKVEKPKKEVSIEIFKEILENVNNNAPVKVEELEDVEI